MMFYPRFVPQSATFRVELSMKADTIDKIEPFSAALSEHFHATQLCEDLQKLVEQDNFLDCTIMSTKDNHEIKVCDFLLNYLLLTHINFRHCVRFFAYARRFSVEFFRLTWPRRAIIASQSTVSIAT